MIRRRLRQLLGLALLAWAGWTIARETIARSRDRFLFGGWIPLYGLEADTGAPTGLRVNALSPAERNAALELERRLNEEWLQ